MCIIFREIQKQVMWNLKAVFLLLIWSTFLNCYRKLVSLPLLLTSLLKMFVTGVWVYVLVQGSPLSESMIWKCFEAVMN